MNKKWYLITIILYAKILHGSFTIITSLYNEKNDDRIAEYVECLENNSAHELIEKIYVLYDTSKDDHENKILHYLETNSLVEIIKISSRPTYGECFRLANKLSHDKKIIICNADIYFNDTLSKLLNYDLSKKFLALTRWDKKKDGSITPYRRSAMRDTTDSQDAWIFQTPLTSFKYDNIMLGVMRCDSCIAYRAKEAGLTVLNPCKTIQTVHVHNTNIRHYNRKNSCDPSLIGEPFMRVAWSYL